MIQFSNTENQEQVFIWGIKSRDDLSSSEANLNTINDLDIIYDKAEKRYLLSIETIYQFKNEQEGRRNYILKMFNQFTDWMISQGYNTEKKFDIYDIVGRIYNEGCKFASVEEVYAVFKCLVKEFGC